MVKTFYDRDSVSEWLLRSLGWWIVNSWKTSLMIDLEKLRDSNPVSTIDWLVKVFGEYSAGYLPYGTFEL
jgi:hypothetical protein